MVNASNKQVEVRKLNGYCLKLRNWGSGCYLYVTCNELLYSFLHLPLVLAVVRHRTAYRSPLAVQFLYSFGRWTQPMKT